MKRAHDTAAVRALEIWKRKGRFWWKAACPLSGIDCRIRPFVHEAGQGPNWPIYWWKAARPFSGSEGGKQTFVHSMGKVANRPFLW